MAPARRRPAPFLAAAGAAVSLLLAPAALAQTLVVPDVPGDAKGKVQQQLEAALRQQAGVELLPASRYEKAAQRLGFKGARAQGARAVEAVAGALSLDGVVVGHVVKGRLYVRVLDLGGNERLVKQLPLRRGLLAEEDGAALARDVDRVLSPATPAPRPAPAASAPRPAPAATATAPAGPPPAGAPARSAPRAPASAPPEAVAAAPATDRPADAALSARGPSLPPDAVREPAVGPRLLSVSLGGATTWRSYCATPGAGGCAAYFAQPAGARPPEFALNFSTAIPYTGGVARLELFPLVPLGDTPLKGLGVLGSFSLAPASVSAQLGEGGTPGQGMDSGFSLMGTYRHHFAFRGPVATLPAFLGLRAGLLGRAFRLSDSLAAVVPGSTRAPFAAGLDAALPLTPLVRLEASALYLHQPLPPVVEQGALGGIASSRGLALEAGVSGDVVGALGYQLRYQLLGFEDRYAGGGTAWASEGHVEERYSTLSFGLTFRL
jgi:hypothetical protein